MIVVGLDPGTTKSAVVAYDVESGRVLHAETGDNDVLRYALAGNVGTVDAFQWLGQLAHADAESMPVVSSVLVIEKIESMGMAVGASTFETVFWTGRFYEAWPYRVERVTRRQVKLHLCGNMRSKDPNIRQALLDKVGPQGNKKLQGPTYLVSGHEWSALAVAVTWWQTVDSVDVTDPVSVDF